MITLLFIYTLPVLFTAFGLVCLGRLAYKKFKNHVTIKEVAAHWPLLYFTVFSGISGIAFLPDSIQIASFFVAFAIGAASAAEIQWPGILRVARKDLEEGLSIASEFFMLLLEIGMMLVEECVLWLHGVLKECPVWLKGALEKHLLGFSYYLGLGLMLCGVIAGLATRDLLTIVVFAVGGFAFIGFAVRMKLNLSVHVPPITVTENSITLHDR